MVRDRFDSLNLWKGHSPDDYTGLNGIARLANKIFISDYCGTVQECIRSHKVGKKNYNSDIALGIALVSVFYPLLAGDQFFDWYFPNAPSGVKPVVGYSASTALITAGLLLVNNTYVSYQNNLLKERAAATEQHESLDILLEGDVTHKP